MEINSKPEERRFRSKNHAVGNRNWSH
jgi:hypothetical protein